VRAQTLIPVHPRPSVDVVAFRARRIRSHNKRTHNIPSTQCLTHVLITVLYFLSVGFVFSASVLESGLGLSTQSTCQSAILVCLTFYIGSKAVMQVARQCDWCRTDMRRYLLLVERAHVLRAPYIRRTRDWLWLSGTVTVAGGFGTIAAVGFTYRSAYFVQPEGRCWIGLPLHVTALLLTFDICINLFLTLTFVYLTRPLVARDLPLATFPASRFANWIGSTFSEEPSQAFRLRKGNPSRAKKVEVLLWKTLIGCVLVVLPTVANLMTMGLLGGIELAWLCLVTCTLDGMSVRGGLEDADYLQ
jgi:hypothetical protein